MKTEGSTFDGRQRTPQETIDVCSHPLWWPMLIEVNRRRRQNRLAQGGYRQRQLDRLAKLEAEVLKLRSEKDRLL